MNNDIKILRELAKKVAEITSSPKQDERRNAWSNHNSLVRDIMIKGYKIRVVD